MKYPLTNEDERHQRYYTSISKCGYDDGGCCDGSANQHQKRHFQGGDNVAVLAEMNLLTSLQAEGSRRCPYLRDRTMMVLIDGK